MQENGKRGKGKHLFRFSSSQFDRFPFTSSIFPLLPLLAIIPREIQNAQCD